MGPKRYRGRPPKKGAPADEYKPRKAKKLSSIKTVKLPVTERDEDEVECDSCDYSGTFREWRIHNLTEHYNIASTKDDKQEKDYRFYERCLKNMAKLMKVPVFSCPRENCLAKYKSTLGLAYHLEQCGKSAEELQANSIQCEVCGKSYTKTTITSHRKIHTKTPGEHKSVPAPKRASAKKAQEKFKSAEEEPGEDEAVLEIIPDRQDEDFEASEIPVEEEVPSKVFEYPPNEDISAYLYKAIQFSMPGSDPWEKPERVTTDIFTDVRTNPLRPFTDESQIQDYLPKRRMSFQFKVNTRVVKDNKWSYESTDFQRLRLFESEVTDGVRGNNVVNVGGPVASLSWHPSGRFLAVAVLRDIDDQPPIHDVKTNPTCIQIYENFYEPDNTATSGLSLKLVLGVASGFIHHLQWSNFWPEDESNYVGHLAYACGDSSIEIIYLEEACFQAPPNVLPTEDAAQLIPMYRKTPEHRLILSATAREEAGKCTTFQWHEEMKYLAAGYASGLVTVFDVQSRSRLLRKSVVMDDKDCTIEIVPIWYIRAHTDAVTAITFASFRSRFIISGSHDYYIKTWDLELRREVESKRIGMILDACWIRGWVHLAVAGECANLNYQMSNHHAVKFFQVGSAKGVINVPDDLNITSLSFFEGMLAEATELGRVTIAYYDQYLRECDYDRNKKKKNAIDFISIEVDKPAHRTTVEEDPRLVISLHETRRDSYHSIPDPTMSTYEDYVVYYRYIRANKVSWCPTGQQLVTGFHNGLLVVSPTSYSKMFAYRS